MPSFAFRTATPRTAKPAVYALGAAKVRRRNSRRVVLALVAILADSRLKDEVRAQAPEGIGVHVHHKQRALRRLAVNALRRQLRDPSPDASTSSKAAFHRNESRPHH